MKNLILVALMFTWLASSQASDDSVKKDQFPRIGAIYQLTFDKQPEGIAWPNQVKIVAKGEGQWYFVEYERTTYPKLKLDSEPITLPTPTPTPTPDPIVTTERQWINFAVVIAANEIE
jgi:hypothetical protein